MPTASIIVPVYNVRDYLETCVDSLLAQTCPDFELLLIDDGSTDGSSRLCDLLTEKDSRIRVIHQENRGLGGARNTGIDAAQGEWLLLVDSDDTLAPETLERTLAAARSTGADLAVFGLRSVDERGNTLRLVKEDLPAGQAFTLEQRPDLLLMAPSAANKLYHRDLFTRSEVRFPPRVWYEDVRTTPKLLTASRGVTAVDYPGYNYLQRKGSIMLSPNVARNREILDAFDDLLLWFADHALGVPYHRELEYLCLYHAFLTSSVRVLRQDKNSPLPGEFAAYLREHFPGYKNNPYLSRLSRNERVLLTLLEKRQYAAIRLIFKLKG